MLKEIEKTRKALSSDTEATLSVENVDGDNCLEQDIEQD